jgi:hypothetical protein
MSNSLSSESENLSSHLAKCCVFYPVEAKNFQSFFEDILIPHLERTFQLDYIQQPYNLIDRKLIQFFKTECQNSSILIIAYHHSITLELSYKLGIAHAYGVKIILINLQKKMTSKPPGCVNYDFLIQYLNIQDLEDLQNFLDRFDDIIISCLSDNVIDFLYKKAFILCESLEKSSSRIISKVDKITFDRRLNSSEISCCLENYSESNAMLLRTIVEDIRILSLIYLNEEESVIKQKGSDSSLVINYTNNNQGATIGSFANDLQDTARQQTNQHNYAAQPQGLLDSQKEINELLDQKQNSSGENSE